MERASAQTMAEEMAARWWGKKELGRGAAEPVHRGVVPAGALGGLGEGGGSRRSRPARRALLSAQPCLPLWGSMCGVGLGEGWSGGKGGGGRGGKRRKKGH